jgi:MerR family transcriptional regulator, heat shock protein HspR
MSPTIIPRDEVARHLAVPVRLLARYEARGLVQVVREGEIEGYAPAEIRRLWSIVSYQRDLGINLAGVEAILKLRAHLGNVHQRLDSLASRLIEALDESASGGSDG